MIERRRVSLVVTDALTWTEPAIRKQMDRTFFVGWLVSVACRRSVGFGTTQKFLAQQPWWRFRPLPKYVGGAVVGLLPLARIFLKNKPGLRGGKGFLSAKSAFFLACFTQKRPSCFFKSKKPPPDRSREQKPALPSWARVPLLRPMGSIDSNRWR